MSEIIIADAGPLVAYLDRSDHHHAWAQEAMASLTEPMWSCEAALAEASFLLHRGGIKPGGLITMVERGILKIPLNLEKEAGAIRQLLERYSNVPMSLADACIVRLSELQQQARVFTTDSDFAIYRRNGRKVIPLLAPWRG